MTRFVEFGAFFAVETHEYATPLTAPWRPFGELVVDPAALRRRVDAVREALARAGGRRADEIELRVAASTAHLGLAARLIAPVVAVAATGGDHLDLGIQQLWWQDRLGEPFPLSVRTESGPRAAPELPGTAIEALTEAVAREFPVSPHVLWGNVGSAANTAAQLMSGARPDLAAYARAGADALLADHRVDGGTLRSGVSFRRQSCCLIYRLTEETSAVCGDCVLTR